MIAKKIAKLNQNSICFLHACKVLWKVLKSGVVEMQCTFKLPLTGSLACCLLVNFCENDLEFPLQLEFIQIIMLYFFFPLLCYPIYYTYFEILEKFINIGINILKFVKSELYWLCITQ